MSRAQLCFLNLMNSLSSSSYSTVMTSGAKLSPSSSGIHQTLSGMLLSDRGRQRALGANPHLVAQSYVRDEHGEKLGVFHQRVQHRRAGLQVRDIRWYTEMISIRFKGS